MARSYNRPPGVTITETTEAVANPLIATPDQIALVGPAAGSIQVTEAVTLTGTTAATFKQIQSLDTNFVVTKVEDYDPESARKSLGNGAYSNTNGYIPGSYTVDSVNHTITRKTDVTSADLKAAIANTNAITTLEAVGDAGAFSGYNTFIIENEQFTYTGIDLTSNEKQTVTITNGNNDNNEVQTVTVTGNAGTFTLTFNAQTTSSLAYNISAANLQTALQGLSTIGAGNVTVTLDAGVYTITFGGALADTDVASLTGTGSGGCTIAIQTTLVGGSDDKFTLTFGGQTTSLLKWNSTAAEVEAALEALSSIGTGNVDVTGNGPYIVEFKGAFAGENVALLTGTGTGCAVTISTTQNSYFTFTGVTRAANGTTAAQHSITSNAIKLGFIIPTPRTVYVTYTYTPKDYFYPYLALASEYSNIEKRFGKAFKDDQVTVNSPLTLAAKIAIENGANELILQPLFYSADDVSGLMPNRSQPTAAQSIVPSTTWGPTFRALQSEENVGIIVPVIGQTNNYSFGSNGKTSPATILNDSVIADIFGILRDHIAFMNTEYDQLIIAIIGEDSTISASYATREVLAQHLTALQSYAQGQYNERFVFIAQTEFVRPSAAGATTEIKLGGQYAAAAVSGKLASNNPQESLTRRTIAGFKSVNDTRTKRLKTQDSGLGFFVIEQNPIDTTLVIRHALTTDTDSVSKSELNAVRSKFYMINSLRRTVDTQVIGRVIADENAPLSIAGVVGAVLRILQDDGVIVQFDSIQAQFDSIDPTQIGVRFNYRPAFAVNYVNIRFSVDLSSGVTSLTTIDQANIGA